MFLLYHRLTRVGILGLYGRAGAGNGGERARSGKVGNDECLMSNDECRMSNDERMTNVEAVGGGTRSALLASKQWHTFRAKRDLHAGSSHGSESHATGG